jgi:hypothetical protein
VHCQNSLTHSLTHSLSDAQVIFGEQSDGSGAAVTASDAQLTARRDGKHFIPTESDDRVSLCRAAYVSLFGCSVPREAASALQFWATERRALNRIYGACETQAKADINGLAAALTLLAIH